MEQDYGRFEPRINDFEDDYHMSDDVLFGDADVAIRQIRRKYRTYNEYIDAMIVIEEYFDRLFEKYGGKKNFEIKAGLGLVKDFIPPIPRFRKTKKNLLQEKAGCVISEQVEEDISYEFSDEFVKEVENASTCFGKGMEVRKGHLIYLPFKVGKNDIKIFDDTETIASELELLQKYTENQAYQRGYDITGGKSKKKKSSHNLLKEAKRRKKQLDKLRKPMTLPEIVDQYTRQCNGLEKSDDETGLRFYRGLIVQADDFNTIQVAKEFEAAGFSSSQDMQSIDSKKLRKMVTEDKKKDKKKKKKKSEVEVDDEKFNQFLDSYNSSDDWGTNFKAWEQEMKMFDSSSMRGIDK